MKEIALDLGSVLFGMFYVSALWIIVEGARDLKRFAEYVRKS